MASTRDGPGSGEPARWNLESLELALKAGRGVGWTWDLCDDSMVFSASAPEVFGWPADEIPTSGDELLSWIPPDDHSVISAAMERAFTTGEPYNTEHRVVTPEGEVRWLSVQGQPVRDRSGRVVRVMGVSADITARKQAEDELRSEKERAQVTLAAIHDGVIRTDAGGRVDFVNPAAARMIGIAPEEAVGRPVEQVYHVLTEDTRQPRPSLAARCLEEERAVQSDDLCTLVKADGGYLTVRDSAAPLRGSDGRVIGVVIAFTDLSRIRVLEHEMAYLATHDALTGLINRREFEKRLQAVIEEAAAGGRRFALGYLDLDDFKVVNDTCGHGAGDELLRQLSSVLASTVEPGDTLARLGGDEFGLLLCATSVEEAVRRSQDVLHAIGRFRFQWEERVFEVRASIGIVVIADSPASMSALLSAADAACYVAKDRGRNQIHLSEPDDAEVAARTSEMRWVERIRHALHQRRFVLHFQLIQPLGDPTAPLLAEVLLRMLDADGSIVRPGLFLSAAERYRLMPDIDRWVVHEAMRWIRDLGEARGGPVFAVNLSGQSLAAAGIRDYLVQEIRGAGVDPARLLLEITETAAISNLQTAREVMNELRSMGCRFVLDDFGSGLSSFRYLRNLGVDFLKIDGELVRGAAVDATQRAMVAAIHQVGVSLGLTTIGEWVENRQVAEVLREVGVDYGQGYWLHRPAPLGECLEHCRQASSMPHLRALRAARGGE